MINADFFILTPFNFSERFETPDYRMRHFICRLRAMISHTNNILALYGFVKALKRILTGFNE